MPVLWRPFHEIDGGWFWWTDPQTPENTAALWRLMFDYFVRERKLHNLIWVYNAAHVSHTRKPPATDFEEDATHRQRYYPGAEYVDIASIDTYANPQLGWGACHEDARRRAYELMQRVAPGKMLAIAEDSALLNPDVAQKDGPAWLYCSAWWTGGKSNPPDWMRKTFNHEHLLTLDELPLLTEGNVMPNVRISEPADGFELHGPDGAWPVSDRATRPDRRSPEAWRPDGRRRRGRSPAERGMGRSTLRIRLRSQRESEERHHPRLGRALEELVPAERRRRDRGLSANQRRSVRRACAGRPLDLHLERRTGRNPQRGGPGRDADNAVACSNVVRVTAGLENLSRGGKATASTTSQHGDPADAAVDGDPNTMWWSDHDKPDPQWLMVDLGRSAKSAACPSPGGKRMPKTTPCRSRPTARHGARWPASKAETTGWAMRTSSVSSRSRPATCDCTAPSGP